MVDDDDPLAERDDVVHVMARQKDRRSGPPVQLRHERPDASLHRDVEAQRGLVEEHDLRAMEESRGELDLHPLTERQLAHRLVDERLQLEELDEPIEPRLEVRVGDPVNLLEHEERVRRWDIPHELCAIPHEQRDPPKERVLASPRREVEDPSVSAGRIEQAGEHLQGRGLARSVRPEEADDLAARDLEVDPTDRRDILELPVEEPAHGGANAGLALVDLVGLLEPAHGHDGLVHRAATVPQRAGHATVNSTTLP